MIGLRPSGAGLLLLFTVACNGAQGPATTETTASSVPEAAIEACRQAQNAALVAPAEERAALIANGCADLFSRAVCREAVRMSAQARTELRGPMIAVACQRDYCPDLSESEPALCGARPATLSPAELQQPWREFLEIVLPLELGISVESPLFTLLATALMTLILPPAAAAPPVRPAGPALRLEVRIETDGSSYRISARLGGQSFGPWEQPLPPDEGDFSGLLEAAIRAADGCAAAIVTESGVAYGVVVELIAALAAGGIDEVSLSPTADPGE